MAFIDGWIDYNSSTGESKIWVVWDFDPPHWNPQLEDHAVEHRSFLLNPPPLDHIEDQRIWPCGLYVTDVTTDETPDGLVVTLEVHKFESLY